MVRRESPSGRRADRFYSTRTLYASGTPARISALHGTYQRPGGRLGKSLAAIENKHFNELNLCTRMTALSGPLLPDVPAAGLENRQTGNISTAPGAVAASTACFRRKGAARRVRAISCKVTVRPSRLQHKQSETRGFPP
ncbi:protein of unknown function [Cupriavidus neocaledonicus]|uniref:Uncharacterized protein n=1 Tax=Cupriavidus neocaledonicus TaxID=1040979 RepID=A0A375H5M2_9BURK|nr:hypothetical protein CBM2605_A170212 [Cupriavidus neocaledonicus]SPD47241.1 protein of unknown function [Cupriavidus neocaledonicus]